MGKNFISNGTHKWKRYYRFDLGLPVNSID